MIEYVLIESLAKQLESHLPGFICYISKRIAMANFTHPTYQCLIVELFTNKQDIQLVIYGKAYGRDLPGSIIMPTPLEGISKIYPLSDPNIADHFIQFIKENHGVLNIVDQL